MTDEVPNKTEDVRFHGGFGLAIRIANLATERARKMNSPSSCEIRPGQPNSGPLVRRLAQEFSAHWRASAEYYQICDRVARGEQP